MPPPTLGRNFRPYGRSDLAIFLLVLRRHSVSQYYNTVFFLNPNSGVPLYVQLQHQLQQRILSGQLQHGVQLPSVRELSAELHINLLTVSKVYQILEREGFIETKRGIGTYVCHQSAGLGIGERRLKIGPAVEQLVLEAVHLGLSEKEIQILFSEKFRQFKPKA
jgi:GntR family transcriptional regulator